jgi:hypothetical protein
MEDDTATQSTELEPAPAATWAQPSEPVPPKLDPPGSNPHEQKLRALAGRTAPYEGPIIGITQGWVSRDTRTHVFAARFLDFIVITDEHLMFCSTGFFTRRPRRRVFLEPFNRLGIVARGPEPYRNLRIIGDFSSPLVLELRADDNSLAFANEVLARSQTGRDFLTARSLPPADERVLPPPETEPAHSGVIDVEAEPDDPDAITAPDAQAALPAPDAEDE